MDALKGLTLRTLDESQQLQQERPEAFNGEDTPPAEPSPGYIATEKTVFCGNCSQWEPTIARTTAIAARRFRRWGWSLTKERGWLCPDCAKERRQSADDHP